MTNALRIGIDCRTILNPSLGEAAGVGYYTYCLVKHLLETDKDNEYVLFFDSRMPDVAVFEQSNVKIWRFPFSSYKRFLPFSYSHMLIAAMILKNRLNVFHSPANVLPMSYSRPSVITVHDLAIYKNPSWFPSQLFSTRLLVPHSVRKAASIITVSECTKRDLQEILGVPAAKITVIPEAAFVERINVKDRNVDAVKKFRLRPPYFLYVGTIEERKNIGMLLEAFLQLRKNPEFEKYQLVLAGKEGHRAGDLFKKIHRSAKGSPIRYLDYVTHNEKLDLMRRAFAFVFPSLYEGFGLPVLEAMQLGVPVITSNASSLPEVAGNAALLIDPTKQDDLERAMARLVHEPDFRASLIRRGTARAAAFSWERVAADTLGVYRRVARTRVVKAKRPRKERVASVQT
ncbi:MAG: glycosyltransferase family 4 protein [Candidatus Kerfeldbacteria bacterium]|nr:glycosyltransferase family 4 protein [Candidatus Kerfeldbacteria bacterium]